MREAISRALILRKGFNFIAIEGDWPDAARIDHYVRHTEYPPSEWTAFARFPVWMWRNNEVRAFVDWLREHNAARKPENRVAFHGLDLYSLYASIRFVLEYLDEVDPAAAKIARERYGCLTPWQADPATYGHAALNGSYPICENDVVRALKDLMGKQQAYATHDGERFLDAVQNARLIANAERYYRIMYYGSRASWNLRDEPHVRNLEDAARASRPAQQGHRLGAQFAYRQRRRDGNVGARRIQYRPALPARSSATIVTRSASAPIMAPWRRRPIGTARWKSRRVRPALDNSATKNCATKRACRASCWLCATGRARRRAASCNRGWSARSA